MAWMDDGMHMLGPDGRMPSMASDSDLDGLRTATGWQVDILSACLMAAHHLGDITMIDGILTRTHNQQVLTLARPGGGQPAGRHHQHARPAHQPQALPG
jgi:uncharacterized protein (DUF305 family)